jgi:glutathione S-transferase
MRLYTVPLSNFGNKSVIVAYEKNLDLEIVPPPGELGSPAYLAINPLGKIPALDVDGAVIPESEVINEYFEDRFPNPPLLPKDAAARARVRVLTRHHDLYLDPPMRALFFQMDPKTRNAEVVKQSVEATTKALDYLEDRIGSPWAAGDSFTLADCALAPSIWYVIRLMPAFGAGDPFAKRPKLAAWFGRVSERPSVKRALDAQGKALAERMAGGQS